MLKVEEIRLHHMLGVARAAVLFSRFRPVPGGSHAKEDRPGANRATEREADTRATENGASS